MRKTDGVVYAELDENGYTRLRRSLIRKSARGSVAQRDFLRAARDTREFLAYMKEAVAIQEGRELEPLADQMSEAEFGNPPSDTERRLFDAWHDLTPRIACRTAFWGRVTYRHVEEGRIESSFLAANGAGNVTGAQRIDAALKASGTEASLLIDGSVRTVLRRLSGLPEARGNRSVYVNCPFARAWWRERLVSEVATGDAEGLDREIRAVVHPESQQYWEDLVTFVVSRNSVFGSVEVRNVLIRSLAKVLHADPQSPLRTSDQLRRLCRSVSSLQASFELSVLPEWEVKTIVRDIVTGMSF